MSGNFPGIVRATLPLTGNEIFLADTTLTQGLNPESETITSAQLASYLSTNTDWVSGRFYGIPLGMTSAALLTVTGTLYAYPVYIPNTVTVKSLNLSVTTGQTGGSARIGIYADNGAGYPGTLVAGSDAGALAATATAVVSNSSLSIVLNPGTYWFASIFTATSTFPSVVGSTAVYTSDISEMLGWDTAAHALATSGQAVTGIQVAATFGALSGINSGVFPASATLTLNAGTPEFVVGV